MTRQPITCDGSTIRLGACKCVAALLCVVIFPGCASFVWGAFERTDRFPDPLELMRRRDAVVSGAGKHGAVIAGPELRGAGADSNRTVTCINEIGATADTVILPVRSIDSVWIDGRADVMLADGDWIEARPGAWCMARQSGGAWRIVLDAGWSRWRSAPVDTALVLAPSDVRSVKLRHVRPVLLALDIAGILAVIYGVLVVIALTEGFGTMHFGSNWRIG